MSEKDKKTVQTITEAVNRLPEDKRGYIIDYAEGVIAASQRQEHERKEPPA